MILSSKKAHGNYRTVKTVGYNIETTPIAFPK